MKAELVDPGNTFLSNFVVEADQLCHKHGDMSKLMCEIYDWFLMDDYKPEIFKSIKRDVIHWLKLNR